MTQDAFWEVAPKAVSDKPLSSTQLDPMELHHVNQRQEPHERSIIHAQGQSKLDFISPRRRPARAHSLVVGEFEFFRSPHLQNCHRFRLFWQAVHLAYSVS